LQDFELRLWLSLRFLQCRGLSEQVRVVHPDNASNFICSVSPLSQLRVPQAQ
jgi:hypothetical protein